MQDDSNGPTESRSSQRSSFKIGFDLDELGEEANTPEYREPETNLLSGKDTRIIKKAQHSRSPSSDDAGKIKLRDIKWRPKMDVISETRNDDGTLMTVQENYLTN